MVRLAPGGMDQHRLHRRRLAASAATIRRRSTACRSQERAERLEVQSSDGLGIVLDTSIRFHAAPGEVLALDQEVGPNYYDVLIGPTLRSQARRVVGRFKPEEIYSTQREADREARSARRRRRRSGAAEHRARGGARAKRVAARATPRRRSRTSSRPSSPLLKMKFVIAGAEKPRIRSSSRRPRRSAERAKIAAESASDAQRTTASASADEECAAVAAHGRRRCQAARRFQATADTSGSSRPA